MSSSSRTPLLPSSHLAQPPPLLPARSFIYPLLGIPHLLTHPRLHPPLLSRLLPLSLLSLFVVVFMFTFLYIPHVLLLSIFHGPLAWSNAAFMVLSEAAGLVAILAEAFFTELQVVEVFDSVLLEKTEGKRGRWERAVGLVRGCREVNGEGGGRVEGVVGGLGGGTLGLGSRGEGNWILGPHRIDPYVKWKESIRITGYFLLELPLNLIPLVGAPLFLALQAYHLGPLAHYRYFQLLDLTNAEKAAYIRRNRFRYWLFGLTHVLLQLVPVASIFFLFTTGTGAALWAVENEKRLWEEEGRPREAPEVPGDFPPSGRKWPQPRPPSWPEPAGEANKRDNKQWWGWRS